MRPFTSLITFILRLKATYKKGLGIKQQLNKWALSSEEAPYDKISNNCKELAVLCSDKIPISSHNIKILCLFLFLHWVHSSVPSKEAVKKHLMIISWSFGGGISLR